jgi:hypothetical protein
LDIQEKTMKGQWIGEVTGGNLGQIIINIDDRGDYYSGVGSFLSKQQNMPNSVGRFRTMNKDTESTFKIYFSPINPVTGFEDLWEDVKKYYPNTVYPKEVTGSLSINENELRVKIVSDLGIQMESAIIKKPPRDESDITGEDKTWDEYKNMVYGLCGKNNLFRGQRRPLRLRTLFHRKGRYDLMRFLDEDRVQLHRVLSAKTSHFFNLEIPIENGAFINLMQHHGYPTPLLDWTRSPCVAAFFTFRGVPKKITENRESVRIFIFDYEKWKNDWKQLNILTPAFLHLSVFEFVAIENERLVPQQSITTVTNIDDIESYIKEKENQKQCSYLRAINISVLEREKAMRELAFMGITAGSMFPGLDGVCEELREQMFDE